MQIKKERRKGNITVFAVLVLAFVSWTVFSVSFLLRGELEVLKDKNYISAKENKENLLEIIFLKTIAEIENNIVNDEETKDIMWYIFKKDGKLLWLENYTEFVKSDSGFFISRIYIKNSYGLEKTYEFSENSRSFRYAGLIGNNSIPKKVNDARVHFKKEMKNIYLEGAENKKYNIKAEGYIVLKYLYENTFGEDTEIECELKELYFEIDEA